MAKPEKQLSSHNAASLPPQEIIDLYKIIFDEELYRQDFDTLLSEIQSVKTHLYERQYLEAFNDDAKRVAYCCRWTPSRTISYASLFCHFEEIKNMIASQEEDADEPGEEKNILCVGGGAGAELVAIASIFITGRDFSNRDVHDKINLQLVDIANWDHVVNRIMGKMKERWLYNNQSESFAVNFQNDDILRMDETQLNLASLNLITLLFTTNELFKENKAESIRFLQRLNKHCQSGCYLLIVESAGSYSHITVGTKKFPIQFLIDTVLVGQRGHESDGAWTLVQQNDSIWYRCDPQLDYPIKLENMRFFYRLYRKN